MKTFPLFFAAAFSLARLAFAGDPAEAAWNGKVVPGLRKNPAFAFVAEDAKLPRVLLIGDSISIGYTAPVRELLKGKANVLRIPANGSSSNEGVEKLDEWLGAGPWAVIHFNWGLHDLKHFRDGKLDLSAPEVSTPEQYEKNLRALVTRLKQTKAKLIWASTTPVPEGAEGRDPGEQKKFNAVATKVMKDEGIPTDDLESAVTPRLTEWQLPKNVHYTPAGYQFLGGQAARAIEAALPKQ